MKDYYCRGDYYESPLRTFRTSFVFTRGVQRHACYADALFCLNLLCYSNAAVILARNANKCNPIINTDSILTYMGMLLCAVVDAAMFKQRNTNTPVSSSYTFPRPMY